MAVGRTVAASGGIGARPAPRLDARLAGAVLLLPLLLLAFCLPLLGGTDPDYWWHLRTGQLIAETGAVPRTDDYSFTVTGQPWVSHEWLTDLLIFLVSGQLGYVGVAALFGAVGAATIALAYRTCRLHGAPAPLAALLCGWALLMMQPSINARPQVLTMLLVAAFAYILSRHAAVGGRLLWATPPLMALWVNLHGGYLIGLVLLGLTVAGALVARILRQEGPAPLPLLGATALAALGSLLTPHGLDALRYPLTYVGRENASLQFVAEWRSPDFHQALFFPFAASLLLTLAVGLGGRPLRPIALLWGLVVAYMALQSVRHIPLYAIVVTPLLAARLAALPWAGLALSARVRRLGRFGAAVCATILPLLLLSGAIMAASGAPGGAWQAGRAPNAGGYPVGGADYLAASGLEGNLFNEYRWGGYLIERFYPERRVFIDGRADPFGDTLMTRYRDAVGARPGWRQFLDEWQIALVLVDRDGPLATALRADPAWREVYVGPVERLFARQGTAAGAGR